MDYTQFRAEVFQHYHQQNYQGALEVILQHGDLFLTEEPNIYSWKFCMMARLGQKEPALEVFRQAVEQGVWWSGQALHHDEDLASLQGDSEFERLVNLCEERRKTAEQESKPELHVFTPPAGTPEPYPLIIALHPHSSSIRRFAPAWKGLADEGWLVAVAQSSQIFGLGQYCWDDTEQANQEIVAHFQSLCRQYPLDAERIVLAGFSQGGGLSISLSLTGRIPAKGFFGIGPYVMDLERLQSELSQDGPRPVKGFVLVGEQDHLHEMFDKIGNLLEEHRVAYQKEVVPSLGHELPADLIDRAHKALGFIFS